MKKLRVIIHIGTEKTGSTSIQHFLMQNRAYWYDTGFLVSEAAGRPSSIRLLAYCLEDRKSHRFFKRKRCYADPKGRAVFRRELREQLIQELSQAPNPLEALLFSCEHFHSRISTVAEIERLRDLLVSVCEELGYEPIFEIIVYLRPQFELVESRYHTHLMSGGTLTFKKFRSNCHLGNDYYNYEVLLRRWRKVFGVTAVHPRQFGKPLLFGGDVRTDFVTYLQLPTAGLADFSESLNQSLSSMGLRALRQVNWVIPRKLADHRPNPTWGKIYTLIKRIFGEGRPQLLKSDDRVRIEREFMASNHAAGIEFASSDDD